MPNADIALYFPDGTPKLYQLTQWLPVFEQSTDLSTIVVVRQVDSYDALKGRTRLRVLLVPRYEDLMALYDRANFHAVVYVNNGWTNFQSLSFQQAVHVSAARPRGEAGASRVRWGDHHVRTHLGR